MVKREAERIVGEIRDQLEGSIVSEVLLTRMAKKLAIVQVENTVKAIKTTAAWMGLSKLERQQLSMDYDHWDSIKVEIEKL